MADIRSFALARRLFSEGERLGYSDLNDTTWAAGRLVLHLLAELTRDAVNDEPRSGVLGEDSFEVTIDSGLNLEVAAGVGMVANGTMTDGDDPFEPAYVPLWLDAAAPAVIGAHHATLPRIDVVSIGPATEDDESVSDSIKDPGTGSVTTSSIATRRLWSGTVTVTAGTAASTPTAPATPTGHLKLAEVNVPATSGAVVIHDYRARLVIGENVGGGASRSVPVDWVPGSSTECQASSAGTDMEVDIAGGLIVCAGQVYYAPRGSVTISASDPTDYRRDIIVYDPAAGWSVLEGTPAGVLVVTDPGVPAGQTPVARVRVEPAVTTIAPSKVDDYRVREPIQEANIEDGAITTDKLADEAVTTAKIDDLGVTTAKIDASAVTTAKIADDAVTEAKIGAWGIGPAWSGDKLGSTPITVNLQATYLNGDNRAASTRYVIEIVDDTTGIHDATKYTVGNCTTGSLTPGSGASATLITNSSGVAVFDLIRVSGSGDARVKVTPCNALGVVHECAVNFT